MSTVARIVAEADGLLDIRSELGVGTRVIVRLPDIDQVAVKPPTGLTVLLVDDEDELREALAKGLIRGGFRVIGCASGQAAIAVLEGDEPIDVLVTDWLMPGEDGHWLLRRAGELRPGLPSVVLTGWADERVPRGTLLKPLAPSELVQRLRVILGI